VGAPASVPRPAQRAIVSTSENEGATRMRTALFPELEIDLDRVWV